MKKLLTIFFGLLLLSGCSEPVNNDQVYSNMLDIISLRAGERALKERIVVDDKFCEQKISDLRTRFYLLDEYLEIEFIEAEEGCPGASYKELN